MDPDEILALLEETDERVLSTKEISEESTLSRRTILERLKALEWSGDIESKQIDGRARVWWIPEDSVDIEEPDTPPPDAGDRDSAVITPDSSPDRDAALDPALDERVDEISLPGSGQILQERRDAVRQCLSMLRERGRAQKSEFIDEIYPDASAGYQSESGWWNSIGKRGLVEIADEDERIQSPPEGSHYWRWID